MKDKILSMLKKEYRLRSLNAGVFHKLVIQGMDFSVDSLEAVELGRVAVMHASGLLGLMKRDTLIVSPLEKDVPVVTYERIQAFGKVDYILGKYDLKNPGMVIKKSGKKKQSAEFDAEIEKFFAEYLEETKTAEKCPQGERKKAVANLVNQFMEENRLSTDIFLANYGVEIADKLYHEVMFGTK